MADGRRPADAALITDMNQPLASAAGNALEVPYAIDYLDGQRTASRGCTRSPWRSAAEMLLLGGLRDCRSPTAGDDDAATSRAARPNTSRAWSRRSAARTTSWSVPDTHLPAAPVTVPVIADRTVVSAVDARAVGLAVVALGGGRTRPQDEIDPAVGFTDVAPIGRRRRGRRARLAWVHAADAAAAERAEAALRAAYRIGAAPPGRPAIMERVGAG